MDLTMRLMENYALEFFTYNRLISVCDNCKKNWYGTLHKCPSCDSMSNLTTFDRFMST
jgi:anaerobic ribonucleoside-triphosphate reductase